ncbi:MAG: hypothetical protein ACXW2I_15170 [Burkholderiales bacterium]
MRRIGLAGYDCAAAWGSANDNAEQSARTTLETIMRTPPLLLVDCAVQARCKLFSSNLPYGIGEFK